MQKPKILLKIYRSRKPHIPLYLIAVLIMGYLLYSLYIGKPLSPEVTLLSIIGVIILIKYIEISRIRDWWAITENSFIESKSILNKNVKEIDFLSIADISLDQPLHKRLLNYGTVEIQKLPSDTTIVIPNINSPEKFINILRDAIVRKHGTEKRLF